MGVMCCPLFFWGKGGNTSTVVGLHPIILNFGASEDAGVNIS
jgi:hypothetical protein